MPTLSIMADVFNKAKRSEVMAAIKSKGNKDTELKLISIFRLNGISGWRRNQKLPGRPDFVFRNERLAVFVDGCFWHVCPKHGRKPESNSDYWSGKLYRNKRRDKKANRELRKVGWQVLRIWEHDLLQIKKVAKQINACLAKSRRQGQINRR